MIKVFIGGLALCCCYQVEATVGMGSIQQPPEYIDLLKKQYEIQTQPLSSIRLLNEDEILPNVDYPDKSALQQALSNFRNRADSFNKVLYNLLYQLVILTCFQDNIKVDYLVNLRLKKDIASLNRKQSIEIEELLSAVKNEVLTAKELVNFNPPIFENKVIISALTNPLHQYAIFLLLMCAGDEEFTSFNCTAYTYRLGPYRREMVRLNDALSNDIEILLTKAQEAAY